MASAVFGEAEREAGMFKMTMVFLEVIILVCGSGIAAWPQEENPVDNDTRVPETSSTMNVTSQAFED